MVLPKIIKVQGIELINPGCGYTVAPSVVVVGGGGAGFAATTTIGDGVVGPIIYFQWW
jgi:heterodisulfide reductase subunit A-like polyferredoxin